MLIRPCLVLLFLAPPIWCAEAGWCQPSVEIEAELRKAEALSAAVTEPFRALDKAAPLKALTEKYPGDLFVHERYQDAIHENGIEGHLQLLTREYERLAFRHPEDAMYRYLHLRTLVGRTTFGAIQGLNELLATHPDFAPAHRTLAEIYATDAFRDAEKASMESAKFRAACPGGSFTHRPFSIPPPSTLLDEAERLFAQGADPGKIVEMTFQGLREFEWRSQRIRAFDYYTLDYKREDAREVHAQYWKAWIIQVRCYRRAGRLEDAKQLLVRMEHRAKLGQKRSEQAYWSALESLAHLYAEGNDMDRARQKLTEMQQLLGSEPDPDRAARLESLRQLIPAAMTASDGVR